MASATLDPSPLHLDSIPTVDLRLLSQSELHALSLCSSSFAAAFDPRRCDDVVIPKIDRSVFNESAGSRKQTFSRLRLAPAASSASLRRRSPHLRPPPPLSPAPDPDRAENSRIIHLFKQLFSPNPVHADSLPIPVDYSEFVKPKRGRPRKDDSPNLTPYPNPNHVNAVVPVVTPENIFEYTDLQPQLSLLSEVSSNGRKRKRGRPRKDGRVIYYDEDDDVAKDVTVIVDDREREVVNKNGIVVDMAVLAGLEDPFGHELKRRTERLVTKEALLEFLSGLDGEWNSKRRKKKAVDASQFGDALPKGWKVSLTIKKREDRVWLICRRYISPNGREFVSCKEVSSYLLSISGVQDTNHPNRNMDIQFAHKMASGNAAGLVALDNNKKENLVSLASDIASILQNHEEQVTMKTGDLVEVQAGELLKCRKCTMTFMGKDDLLHHQSSSHRRRRSKIGTSLTDGVIIKSGEYECQFCHKRFSERRRYYGHIGAHVKYDVKNAEALTVSNASEGVDAVLLGGVPDGEPLQEQSLEANRSVAKLFDASANNELISDSPPSELNAGKIKTCTDNYGHDLNVEAHNKLDLLANNRTGTSLAEEPIDKSDRNAVMIPDKVAEVDEVMGDVAAKSNLCLGSEAALSSANRSDCETLGETNVTECVARRRNEDRSFESGLASPLLNEQKGSGLENNVVTASVTVEETNLEPVSKSCSLSPKGIENTSGSESMDDRVPATNESKFGFCNSHADLDEDSATEVKQQPSSEGHTLVPSGNELYSNIDNVRGVGPESDRVCNLTSLEKEIQHESSSVVSSWSERIPVTENCGNEVSTCTVEETRLEKASESSLLSLSSYDPNCGAENYVDTRASRQMEGPKLSEVQMLGNNEAIFPYGRSHSGVSADGLTSHKDRSLKFCSLIPSDNEQTFGVQANTNRVYDTAAEKHGNDSSVSRLLTPSHIPGTSNNVYMVDNSRPVNEHKFDGVRNSGNHELSLSFGIPQTGLYADTTTIEQDFGNSSVVPAAIEHNFGVQTNLGGLRNSIMEDPKQGRGPVSDLFSLSFDGQKGGFGNNINNLYSGGVWEGAKVDEVKNSQNNKFVCGFSSSHVQPEGSVPGGIWRTGEENTMRSGLADTSNPLVQSSSTFRSFDIFSDKPEDGLFGLDDKYDNESAFEGLRLGRSEPVEFSFLTTQTSNTFQGNSKAFAYNPEMEQEFDSSFWLGKDALTPNIGGRNQVSTICVWCRNEFLHEPMQLGTETAYGSMCPTCRARIS